MSLHSEGKNVTQIICTVDVVLLTLQPQGLQVALLQREHEPYRGAYALPGGFIHPQEDANARAAAMRMLRDKTGIAMPYLEQLASFSGIARDPRGWSVSIAYYALVAASVIQAQAGLRWADVDANLELPFDHKQIVDTAVARLRSKSQYSSLPCHLMEEVFSLPQLQRVYETLLGEEINKVSFRRKITEMAILQEVEGQTDERSAHRPAQLYRLKPEFRQQLQMSARGFRLGHDGAN